MITAGGSWRRPFLRDALLLVHRNFFGRYANNKRSLGLPRVLTRLAGDIRDESCHVRLRARYPVASFPSKCPLRQVEQFAELGLVLVRDGWRVLYLLRAVNEVKTGKPDRVSAPGW